MKFATECLGKKNKQTNKQTKTQAITTLKKYYGPFI